jgi:hypothetical protein
VNQDGSILAKNLLAKNHELLRVWIGKRPQEHGVQEGEDRGVRADAQRQ